MGTIVQSYGPIYGEVVNGTVQGRPNGSIYVPLSNTVELTFQNSAVFHVVEYSAGAYRVVIVSPNYATMIAKSQDLSNYIQQQVFSDAACTDLICTRNLTAGLYNRLDNLCSGALTADQIAAFTVGTKYYFRCQLMASGGSPVATSTVTELECVA